MNLFLILLTGEVMECQRLDLYGVDMVEFKLALELRELSGESKDP